MKRVFLLVAVTALATSVPRNGQAAPADRGPIYRVTGVAPGDTLKVRQEPALDSTVLAELRPDQSGLTTTGRVELVGKTPWREVTVAGKTGWVAARFIQPDVAAAPREQAASGMAALKDDIQCSNSEPAWFMDIARSGAVKPDPALELTPDVRVTHAELAAGLTNVWYVQLGNDKDRRMVTALIKETGTCKNPGGSRFKYEIYLKREGGEFLPGCCHPAGAKRRR
jgi:hypothetical protein